MPEGLLVADSAEIEVEAVDIQAQHHMAALDYTAAEVVDIHLGSVAEID